MIAELEFSEDTEKVLQSSPGGGEPERMVGVPYFGKREIGDTTQRREGVANLPKKAHFLFRVASAHEGSGSLIFAIKRWSETFGQNFVII